MNDKENQSQENQNQNQAAENNQPEVETIDPSTLSNDDIENLELDEKAEEEFFKSKGKTLTITKKDKKAEVNPADKTKTGAQPQQKEVVKPTAAGEPSEAEKKKMVDLGALVEERGRRKDLEKKLDQAQKVIDQFMTKDQQQKAGVKEIDPEEDPITHMQQQVQQMGKVINAITGNAKQQFEQNQFMNVYTNKTREFVSQQPDYEQAYSHLIQTRYKELTAFGFNHDQAQKTIHEEEKWLVGAALQQDQNPAEKLYKLSEMRGYKRAEAQQNQQGNNNQQQQKPAQQSQSATEKLENIEKGQNLNKSFKGGQVAGKDLTDELLAAIDDENPFDNLKGESALDKFFINAKKSQRN